MLFFAQNVTIITPPMTGSYPRISYDALLTLPNPAKGDMASDMTFNSRQSELYTHRHLKPRPFTHLGGDGERTVEAFDPALYTLHSLAILSLI